jgi:hypothetical protein
MAKIQRIPTPAYTNPEFCPEHGEVVTVEDEGVSRCPECERATSTTLEEAVRFESQDRETEVSNGN